MELVKKCIEIAQQAPTASNRQNWHFMVITDQSKKNSLSELFRKGWQSYIDSPTSIAKTRSSDDPKKTETQRKIYESAKYLADNLRNVPVFVIPCIEGRTDGSNISVSPKFYLGIHCSCSLEFYTRGQVIRVGHNLD
jgi:nitroreductase